jgi:hypothetical protein
MGFYIRKGFNFGPLRLNLSRSGLGASFGVKGARIGIGPRGSYVHMGRDGLYYRQTLHFGQQSPSHSPSVNPQSLSPQQAFSVDGLQEISSAPAIGMLDSSAGQLLQELNRVKRRMDLFPIIGLAGAALFVHLLYLGVQPWIYVLVALALVSLALFARNNDVTNGTAILNYSFEGNSSQVFDDLKRSFAQLAGCRGVWRVEAEGATSDWKRNAGASTLERRKGISPSISRPPKVESNIDVPTLSAGRRSLYFFPDRLLVYDSSGVGAVSYADLKAQSIETRFIENDNVPSDAKQVGTTWRFVARSGGPDRRFNNNRQLPILLYGEMALTSTSGLNELFQYSVPERGIAFASAIDKLNAANPSAAYGVNDVADKPSVRKREVTKVLLWVSVWLIVALFLFIPWPPSSSDVAQMAQQAELAKQEQARRARQDYVDGLNRRFVTESRNTTAGAEKTNVAFQFTKEGPKAARRDGIEPFDETIFFNRVLRPDTEHMLCDLGFQTLSITRNADAPRIVTLTCGRVP